MVETYRMDSMKGSGIYAFDPGGTTGIAYTYSTRINLIVTKNKGPDQHHSELWHFLNYHQPNIIVYERFQYRPNPQAMKVDLIPREYIGILKLYALENKLEIYGYSAGNAKTFIQDTHLKKLELWKDKTPHERDAIRHLLYYLMTEKQDPYWLNLFREL